MTEPNYKPTPSTAPTNVLRALNSQRSRVTNSYKGISNSPLDNDLFNLRMSERPQAIPIHENIADHEIKLSKDKRKFFSPKQYQTIIANFDLSNLNASYDTNSYVFDTNDNKYYNNTFSKSGLEKVFRFNSGFLSIANSRLTDRSRLFVQIQTTSLNMANYEFDYMFALHPDSALSTSTRTTFKPEQSDYQLNGFCSLNNIKLSIRDIAGNVILPEPRMLFTIASVGVLTTLNSVNHGLVNGMLLYLSSKSNLKNIFSGIYTVTVLDNDNIQINANTSSSLYLVGSSFIAIIDDYVFNYNLKIHSIREDENTGLPNVR
jgi:hypothetical protein